MVAGSLYGLYLIHTSHSLTFVSTFSCSCGDYVPDPAVPVFEISVGAIQFSSCVVLPYFQGHLNRPHKKRVPFIFPLDFEPQPSQHGPPTWVRYFHIIWLP